MLHKSRGWSVVEVETAAELAEKLTEMTWCGCAGFRVGSLLFLNDSTSGDGAQEYAVVRDGRQVDSVTFGWMTRARALVVIEALLAEELGESLGTFEPRIQTPEAHGRCELCR